MSDAQDKDKFVKSLLKKYKKLEVDLAKFNSKHNGVVKTNILRTTLLPFLRSPNLVESYLSDAKIYRSLVSISTSILLKWWRSLLTSLLYKSPVPHLVTQNTNPQVSYSDRNAYLECISRILARSEWLHTDKETHAQLKKSLTATLDYAINKLLTMKIIPISISAFVGKVFAYCFFYLPNVSNALLFLLNIKQATFELATADLSTCVDDVGDLKSIFPGPVHHLINFAGIPNLPRKRRPFINAIPPPTHPVAGIKDPNGTWVRRWFSSDSDVFNSFFRHYINIVELLVLQKSSGNVYIPVYAYPGFSVLLSHISQILHVSISRILKNACIKPNAPASVLMMDQSMKKSSPQAPPSNDVYYVSITKLMKTVRDIDHLGSSLKSILIKYIDSILIKTAQNISIHDNYKNGLVLDIFHEFANHVVDVESLDWEFWLSCNYIMIEKSDHIQTLLKSLSFLYNVWDMVPESLPNETTQVDPALKRWLKDPTKTFKLNFIDWLVSNDIWYKFFLHWHPIVRSYYIRFLVWRVIGINNFETSTSIKVTKLIEQKLAFCHERLLESSQNSTHRFNFMPDRPLVNRKFGIIPTNLKNEFLMIGEDTELSPAAMAKPSELRKTHPYEIFDEAIYSCSSLPSSSHVPSRTNSSMSLNDSKLMSRNNSLVSSIGKLFKILSSDEKLPEQNESPSRVESRSSTNLSALAHSGDLRSKRNSVSWTSLSTAYSSRSRSSSPSIMSFQSTPTSFTDFSNGSSLGSDVSSVASYGSQETSSPPPSVSSSQPPEISRIPPAIARPLYKFDIVVDYDMMNAKYSMMQYSNNSVRKFYSPIPSSYTPVPHKQDVPEKPRIPAVTIFVNDDGYNHFYISTENILLGSDQFNDMEAGEYEEFVKDFDSYFTRDINWVNLGKSINEWHLVVDEFEKYLIDKVEIDEFNSKQNHSHEGLSETEYFRKIIPFLPVDSSTEFKFVNAG